MYNFPFQELYLDAPFNRYPLVDKNQYADKNALISFLTESSNFLLNKSATSHPPITKAMWVRKKTDTPPPDVPY